MAKYNELDGFFDYGNDGLFDFDEAINSIEPVEIDLSCCDTLAELSERHKMLANTGKESIIVPANQIIQEA